MDPSRIVAHELQVTASSHKPYNGMNDGGPDESGLEVPDADADIDIHLASAAEKKRLWWRSVTVNGAFIGSWFFFALILQLYNKWMFSPDRFGFPSPLFVTMLHMFVQWGLAALIRGLWPQLFRSELIPTKGGYLWKAMPTAVTTGLDIGLSNLSLRTITLSFYTMCKSSSLIFVLGFAFAFGLEKFSFRLVAVISLIFSGVLLMVATETHFALTGFILVISASGLGGLRWSLTQVLMRDKQLGIDSPVAAIFWLAPVMGLTVGLASLVLESWSSLVGNHFFDGVGSSLQTLFFLVLPGVLAFAMVISEYSIIQRAGVVPMSIAGIAKEVATISSAAWFFGDELTPLNIVGVAITVCGIALFTYHKYQKTMDSSLALDMHGRPVSDAEDDDIALRSGYQLAAEHPSEAQVDGEAMHESDDRSNDDHILFSAGAMDTNVGSPSR